MNSTKTPQPPAGASGARSQASLKRDSAALYAVERESPVDVMMTKKLCVSTPPPNTPAMPVRTKPVLPRTPAPSVRAIRMQPLQLLPRTLQFAYSPVAVTTVGGHAGVLQPVSPFSSSATLPSSPVLSVMHEHDERVRIETIKHKHSAQVGAALWAARRSELCIGAHSAVRRTLTRELDAAASARADFSALD